MRGFRNALGISRRPYAASILILFTLGAVLFSNGCSGLVSSSDGGGNPGPLAISNDVAANFAPTSQRIDGLTTAPANFQGESGATTRHRSHPPVVSEQDPCPQR